MTNFDTVREALAAIADTHVHTYKQALTTLAELERQHYTPADMADASAKGFRDGVASVAAGQEPVAKLHNDGRWTPMRNDAGRALDKRLELESSPSVEVFAAPVAQQPQARPDFADEWTGYLKDGETPFERFLRERKDLGALTKLYQRALEENEQLKAQPAQQAQPIKSICTDCRHTDSWGLPDSPHCNRCEGGKMWEPLNTSSVNPNVAQQEPPDDATIAGLESSIGILSTLVDEQRQLLGECEAVFGRDDLGLPFEDGDSALIDRVRAHLAATNSPAQQAQAEAVPQDVLRDAERYRAINTPEISDFLASVHNEALHQRERWGSDHDEGKTDADWFWLLGYLGGKAMHAATDEKRLHHIITTAAACLNWHAARVGAWASMRPGIDPAAHGIAAAPQPKEQSK